MFRGQQERVVMPKMNLKHYLIVAPSMQAYIRCSDFYFTANYFVTRNQCHHTHLGKILRQNGFGPILEPRWRVVPFSLSFLLGINMNDKINILVVDDHPAVRLAVKYVLNSAGFLNVIQASTGIDAINENGKVNFDIIIMDLNLPNLDGLEVVKRIKRSNPTVRILILSALVSDVYVMRCYAAGVHGFMEKNEDIENLPLIVANMMKGFTYFPHVFNDKEQKRRANLGAGLVSCLSDRELTVFNKLVMGKTNLEIANELFLSNKTVSTYKTRLFHKLGVSNIAELIEISKGIEE